MTIKPGDTIPSVTLYHKGESGIEPISTDDLFRGKKAVLFAVPGAFTPTCSNQHLPGFVTKADEIMAKGVDVVACVAVNDVFVMDAWGADQKAAGKVMMLADGSGELAQALGMALDLTSRGLGVRSARYAMIVNDGTVEHLFAEDGGAFEVSSADNVLAAL